MMNSSMRRTTHLQIQMEHLHRPCLLVQVIQVFVGITVLAPTRLTLIQIGQETNTSVSGGMINGTDKAPTHLRMETNTSVNTRIVNKMDKAPIPLVQTQNGQETNTSVDS